MREPFEDDIGLTGMVTSFEMVMRVELGLARCWYEAADEVDRSPLEALLERDVLWALMESAWTRGRVLIEFLLGWGTSAVHAGDYLPGWELPVGPLREELIDMWRRASKVVVHRVRDPGQYRGLTAGMPSAVLRGFQALLDAAPPGHLLHDAFDDAVDRAKTGRW